jgi:hypothetical protein
VHFNPGLEVAVQINVVSARMPIFVEQEEYCPARGSWLTTVVPPTLSRPALVVHGGSSFDEVCRRCGGAKITGRI